MIMKQRFIGIVASVLLAVMGAGLLVMYVRGAEHRALKGQKATQVLVVTDMVAKGTKAEDIGARTREEMVPAKVAAQGAVASIESLAGEVALVDLLPGEQVVGTRFGAAAQAERAGVPPGMLQVTVAVDQVRAVGGGLRTGDTVGVVVSFDDPETSRFVLHKLKVTDVRTEQGAQVTSRPQDPFPPGKMMITLAVDSPSAERLVFGAEHGRLWLGEEPQEANEGGTHLQTKATLNA
jgi:pilus assembly protein CpaB